MNTILRVIGVLLYIIAVIILLAMFGGHQPKNWFVTPLVLSAIGSFLYAIGKDKKQ